MGDRGVVGIKQNIRKKDDYIIYLYTHWGGSELPETLRRALAKKWRWDDNSYLARIILCEMVKDEEDGETGYGISGWPMFPDHTPLIVDCETQTVSMGNRSWSFEEYLNTGTNNYAHIWEEEY